MKVKFTPEQLDEGQNAFSGFIEIKMPSYPERLRFPKEIGLDVTAGEVGQDDISKVKSVLSQLDMLATASEKVFPFIESVDLKHLESGVELKTPEDFFGFPDAGGMVTGLCMKFVLGFMEKKTKAV